MWAVTVMIEIMISSVPQPRPQMGSGNGRQPRSRPRAARALQAPSERAGTNGGNNKTGHAGQGGTTGQVVSAAPGSFRQIRYTMKRGITYSLYPELMVYHIHYTMQGIVL